MAINPYVSKVIVNNTIKLDLTADTVDAAHLANGYTAHDKSGAPITGSLVVPNVQSEKSYSALSNGSFVISPNSGYEAMEKVKLTVSVASNLKTGTFTPSSDIRAQYQIITVDDLEFVPNFFMLEQQSGLFTQVISSYASNSRLFRTTYNSAGDYYVQTQSGHGWTTKESGYLWYDEASGDIYFQASSSYRLSKGTWKWTTALR